MRCRDPVKSARSNAERLRRVMVEGIRASYEPVCGAEGQGSTWWSGRWRAVLSHDASFGQDERQNLQPRQDCHQHADQPKKTKLVVVHLNPILKRKYVRFQYNGNRPALTTRAKGGGSLGIAVISYEISCVHADPAYQSTSAQPR